MRRTLTDTDFLLAAFVFFASLIVAVYAYASIQEIERPSYALISGLKNGESDYKIIFNKECPGEIHLNMAYDAVWGLQSEGLLRVSYGKMQTDARMKTAAFFNPLGQLNSAKIELKAENFNLTATLTNPHPINIDIDTSGNGPQYHEHFSIPGPFTIQRNGDGTYRIDYAYFALTQNPSVKAMEGIMSREFSFSVVDAAAAPKVCGTDGAARLDLLPLIARSSSLVNPFLALMDSEQFRGH